MPNSQELSNKSNLTAHIDTYLFKIYPIILQSTPRTPRDLLQVELPVKMLKAIIYCSIMAPLAAILMF